MRSLSWKLGGALLLIVVISVGLMFYLTDLGTTREFNQYVAHGNAMYLQMASDSLGQHYAEEGSWSAVQGVLTDLTQSPGDRLVLADSSGTIVGDTGNQWLGRSAPEVGLTGGTPVTAAGHQVGELYLVSSGPGSGMGRMMGRMMGGDSTPPTATAEQDFLDRTRTNLWLAGLIAAAIALVLGLVITRQITRPIRALTEGARHLARGEMEHRVNVSSRDEIGQLARSFNIMADNLHQGEITRRQLIADVAHELRTPLSVIEGTVDGMLDGVFPASPENLTSIKEETGLLTRLIGDLRDLSLAESGQLKLQLAPANMVELVQHRVSQAEVKARARDVKLILNATPTPEVRADAARLEQVVGNLLDNAVRHTQAGGTVTVSVKTTDEPGVVVSVADTGEGIPAEYLPHVFERFYRVESSRARSSGGAGLGLAIVKQMVAAHGGRVWAESQPGRGSTFYFSLPQSPG